MRKWWIALVTVLALSVGAAWGEDSNGKSCKKGASGSDGTSCCCCSESCHK